MNEPSSPTPSKRSQRQRQHWWWWALMAVAAVATIIVSSSKAPSEGVGNDRLFYLAAQLKCVQCVGESVASSSAPLAVQFRTEIREQMAKGRTNDEILNFFATRYDDVLLNPPASGLGSLVWILPVVAMAAAVMGLGLAFRRWSTVDAGRHASEEDQILVEKALQGDGS